MQIGMYLRKNVNKLHRFLGLMRINLQENPMRVMVGNAWCINL